MFPTSLGDAERANAALIVEKLGGKVAREDSLDVTHLVYCGGGGGGVGAWCWWSCVVVVVVVVRGGGGDGVGGAWWSWCVVRGGGGGGGGKDSLDVSRLPYAGGAW